ncbi:MAG: glycosyltransferase [Acidobacteriota bacterium]|nr:glycosyltransferase [Acidobacteriota bacterium]
MIRAESKVLSPKSEAEIEHGNSDFDKNLQTKKSLKIVRIIARLNVGGPARHVVWLTRALQGGEYQTVLLAGRVPESEEDMSYFAAENAVAPVYIEAMSRELSPKDVVSLWKIFRQLQREKPDIIHTHTAKAGTVGRVAGFLYRWLAWKNVKIVHTFHGHIFHSYYGNFKTKIFLLIEKTLAKMATDKIVVISRQQFAEIHERFGVGKREQFEIIPLGIDLEAFADWRSKRHILREEIGANADEILVGLVGRLTEVKNHALFLEVVKIWQAENQTANQSAKVKFVIVGDGHLRESLEAQAENLGIKDALIFLGNRNDADVFYAGLDIIALTSLNEGTPLSLIEAMANEKPVVSTAVGGVVDLLGKIEESQPHFQICERGIAAASGDAQGFCDGLRYLVNDDKMRETLGRRGRDYVAAQYGKNRLINDISGLYEDLIKS